jgi:hypothetical protein
MNRRLWAFKRWKDVRLRKKEYTRGKTIRRNVPTTLGRMRT